MLSAFARCYTELENLQKFHASAFYAFTKTEDLAFSEGGTYEPLIIPGSLSIVERPIYFRMKVKHVNSRRRALNEVVYVRTISILEVYLTDTLNDVFEVTKTPFKNGTEIKFSQSELLSISSEDLHEKIINKERRKLSSGGFKEVVKYYKRNFRIDLSVISPGLRKMEEYHDKRHLLVHQVGRIDNKFRSKYEWDTERIEITDEFLNQVFLDIYSFAKGVNRGILLLIQDAKSSTRS